MKTMQRITHSDWAQLSFINRVSIVFLIWRKIEEINQNFGVIDDKDFIRDSQLIHETLENILSKEKPIKAGLANKFWKIVFDYSIKVKNSSNNESQDDSLYHNLVRIIHECSTFVYQTILAFQSKGLPNSIYLARSIESLERIYNDISRSRISEFLDLQNKIDQEYNSILMSLKESGISNEPNYL
jgi:hypothetical protein